MDEMFIITKRGNIPLHNLVVGDVLYEYYNCRPREIVDLRRQELMTYEVKFKDGRLCYYSASEVSELYKRKSFIQNIMYYGADFDFNVLDPDPYVAGALLFYGDQNEAYVNIPSYIYAINRHFFDKYHITYDYEHSDLDHMRFKFKGQNDSVEPLKWVDLFPKYKEHFNDPAVNVIFPIQYERAWVADRLKLIRGIFDAGFHKRTTGYPDKLVVFSPDFHKIEYLQKLMLSLGIESRITENTDKMVKYIPKETVIDKEFLPAEGGDISITVNLEVSQIIYPAHKLQVLGKRSMYPGFFYDIDTVSEMVINGLKRKEDRQLRFQFGIEKITQLQKEMHTIPVFTEPTVCYLADDFLPKFSGTL